MDNTLPGDTASYMSHINPTGTGAAELNQDRRERLLRMAENLKHDLMMQDGLGPELRRECLLRVKRWINEAGAVGPFVDA